MIYLQTPGLHNSLRCFGCGLFSASYTLKRLDLLENVEAINKAFEDLKMLEACGRDARLQWTKATHYLTKEYYFIGFKDPSYKLNEDEISIQQWFFAPMNKLHFKALDYDPYEGGSPWVQKGEIFQQVIWGHK